MAPRSAVRVLVLDDDDRLLLVRFRDGERTWWCTPGGGVEPGETNEQAVARELREELGMDTIHLGPCVWTRRHAGTFRGRRFDHVEQIYFARVAGFEPRPLDDAGIEEGMDAVRWWTPAELTATGEAFAPRDLASLVRSLLDDGPPAAPIDVGV